MWSFAPARGATDRALASLAALAARGAAGRAAQAQPRPRAAADPRPSAPRRLRADRARRSIAHRRRAPRRSAAERERHPGLAPDRLHARPRALAGELVRRRRRARPGARRRPHGAILEQWTGDQVAWTMARGYEGAFGRKLNAPYVWIPLCLLFLVAVRRPAAAVPAAAPRPARAARLRRLARLLQPRRDRTRCRSSTRCCSTCSRACCGGLPPARARRSRWCRSCPSTWLVVGLVFLVGFRVGLNVVDSNVIDVGYAGVIGADRIADGDDALRRASSATTTSTATPTGPLTYLAYVPFEQVMPWSGELGRPAGGARRGDHVRPADALGLFLLGRRLRRAEGALGVALAYAWAAYPYSAVRARDELERLAGRPAGGARAARR